MLFEDNEPAITKAGLLNMQVCVPQDWTRYQVEAFAERENPCGTTHGWQETERPEVARVPCEKRDGFVHVILDC